ncbi:MAG: molybdopterin dinucleotide binding domain-containing protein [Candidatus Thorarchaeota archaeon]
MNDVGVEVLLTSGRTLKQGQTMELGKLNQEYFEAVAICEVDKSTLVTLGLEEGDPVKVKTTTGSVVVACKVDRRAEPGIAFIPCGPWANAVLDSDTSESGMPRYKEMDAKLFAAKGEKIPSAEDLLKAFVEAS